MNRPWAVKRRILYGMGFFVFLSAIVVAFYFAGFYQEANCFDGEMNGEETGVDCGGDCVRVCAADVLPPQVSWAESFEVAEGQYNAVAYVNNPNQTVGAPEVQYTFNFYSDGTLVNEVSGTTELPPNTSYPLFEGRVFVDADQPITDTEVRLEPIDLWLPASYDRNRFSSSNINLVGADSQPRLNVDIQNTSLRPARNLEVVATIFNGSGDPVNVSQTLIESIEARSEQAITFTWPNPIAKTVTSCIIPTDVAMAIDLSGSMNNDGDNPPQPLTDTLEAAGQFIQNLKPDDQVSVITFASEGDVYSPLGPVSPATTENVLDLNIAAAEESGYTNTLAALELAEVELNSTEHNPDARRVLVLLTDGLPTAPDDQDIVSMVEAKAEELNESGVTIYAIGLGSEADRDLINDIASGADSAFFAPSGSDLQSIYNEITSSICEVGPTKIDIIPRTQAEFESMR